MEDLLFGSAKGSDKECHVGWGNSKRLLPEDASEALVKVILYVCETLTVASGNANGAGDPNSKRAQLQHPWQRMPGRGFRTSVLVIKDHTQLASVHHRERRGADISRPLAF